MHCLRPFRNTDPPALAEIWRSQPPQRGIVHGVSASLLEQAVFSKLHFDRYGLIVATRNGEVVGFVHAGFGPNDKGTCIDTSLGTTTLLMLRGGHDDPKLADELLFASEEYLRSQGAHVIYAGGIKPLNSFYLGLYGGSEIPGVFQSNKTLCDACLRNGYRQSGQVSILQCDLARFRPSLSRKVRQLRRTMAIEESTNPIATNWWEACVWGSQERDRFRLVDRPSRQTVAAASFWDVQPLSASWGICTAGLFELFVAPPWRRQGCATYLLGEAFRQLRSRGVATVEAQTMATNEAANAFYRQLGFVEIDQGLVFRKEEGSAEQSRPNAAAATIDKAD